MRSLFDTSLATIEAAGLQVTSGVSPAAAAVRSNSVLTGALPALCSHCCWFSVFFFFYLHFALSPHALLQALNKWKSHSINLQLLICFAAGPGSPFLFLFVGRAACFVVFAMPLLSGLLCGEDARSGVCHIRCVRMPIGHRLLTGAILANQLSASWPFRCHPDPDGRWSVWLVAVSTGTAGWGGGGGGGEGPGQRARDFLGQSLPFPSSVLL